MRTFDDPTALQTAPKTGETLASPTEHCVNGEVRSVDGQFVDLQGQPFYRIANTDRMRPFLMSIVSSGNLWMYVSSGGGLTAGRVSAEHCLFPYETVDKLHHCSSYTGPLTLIRWTDANGERKIWRPFAEDFVLGKNCQRSIYKHIVGDQVVFEETEFELGLTFRYCWRPSREFGFVRTVSLRNLRSHLCEIDILDGLQNIQPHGIDLGMSQQASCLTDAYKFNEHDPATGIGVFSLTAKIHDQAEAVEVMKATTVWSAGLEDAVVLLSTDQFRNFCCGGTPKAELLSNGLRGSYFVSANLKIEAGETCTWSQAADVSQDHSQIDHLRTRMSQKGALVDLLQKGLDRDHDDLIRNVASSDGLQATGSSLASAHHFANVLFNNMRGGVFPANYDVETEEFVRFVEKRNRTTHSDYQQFFAELPATLDCENLIDQLRSQNDRDLLRLGLEYLPLTFGRRHGDPSRPWNHFTIHASNADNSPVYHYEGNWRDIFQNWEALCLSFPKFLPGIITKFVNASTVDGFNPYRVLSEGFEWEVPNPDDPWSNIGYWGDHQLIYLSKLLESHRLHFPAQLENMLSESLYCYADVPYRIEPYGNLVANCRETIRFDEQRAEQIRWRVKDIGEDGKHLAADGVGVQYVTFLEKLLVPALSKLSNLVLDGGIWMNTQRPEWNDANNALVGPGLSVVTACYLQRYLAVVADLLRGATATRFELSTEVAQWLHSLLTAFKDHRHFLQQATVSDRDRRILLDRLGGIFSEYRSKVYEHGMSGTQAVEANDIQTLICEASDQLSHTIQANQRADGLYHAYNLLDLNTEGNAATVSHLYEMLEGQVAALSTGRIAPDRAVDVIRTMFESPLFRVDQNSFLLYPNRNLLGFSQRNLIPEKGIQTNEFLQRLLEENEGSLILKSLDGQCHFHSDIQRVSDLSERLLALGRQPQWAKLVEQHTPAVKDLFDQIFHHSKYTGRSGTMFGYEGLGSIYWHMVAKLLVAVQEVFFQAIRENAAPETIQALGESYYRIRGGLSSDKSPEEYGAFPTDPYSHTPHHSGAQQPGMTGQVKEEILSRRGELGVHIQEGCVCFNPRLLRESEFVVQPVEFEYYDVHGNAQIVSLRPKSLAFTIYQTLVIYHLVPAGNSLDIECVKNGLTTNGCDCLDAETSEKLFQRCGELLRIEVTIPEDLLFCEEP